MANTKISQLPLWSGTAADLRWFVMNNSGETETYKFSGYTSPYKRVGSNNTNNIYDTTAMGGTFGSIIGGSSNTISGGINNAIIGGSSNTNSSTRGVVVGGNGNTAGGTSNIVGGENNNATGYVAFSYGTNNQNSAEVAFIGGGASCNAAGQTIGIIGAEQGRTVGSTSVMKQSFIGGGFQNTITTSLRAAIIGGQSNSITSSPDSAIIGGQSNTSSQFTSVIVNSISSTISGSGSVSGIYSSQSSTINADGTYNIIIGGFGNVISGGSAAFSSIIGSYNSSLVNRNNSVMLGTSGRTGTSDYTTYVENIHSFRTPSTQVQSVVSGTTFTCNLELGAKSQFYITGTSTINITNVRDGASFMIKTQTDGNYVMTWTATGGYTFVFEGGIKDPGNTTTDIFVFEVFGSVIYGSRRHNFS